MSHPTDRIDRALSTRETLRATYDMARNCIERGVPGEFVECGVFAGAQCAAMALAIIDDVVEHDSRCIELSKHAHPTIPRCPNTPVLNAKSE